VRSVMVRLACVVAVLAPGLVFVSVGSGVTAGARSAGAATASGVVVPRLVWRACTGKRQKGFQCATARVPLDYRYPRGAMIELAVILHPASDQARRLGSVFFNPGGPGGSGVQTLPSALGGLPPVLVARFDWVSWDPRGVGASTAVQCFASQAAEQRFLAGESFPVGRAQMNRWIGRYRIFGKRCAQRNGRLLEHISTADTARDLDLLRRAVGDRTLNYLGNSYGTFLGATYANLFPNRVRAMVLSSNIAPQAWVQGAGDGNGGVFLSTYLRQRSDQGSAKTLSAFLELCGRTDTAHCAFSAGSPAATRARFAALLARLRRHPAGAISYAELVSMTLGGLYNSTTGWSTLATELQKVWAGGASPASDGQGLATSSSALSKHRSSRANAARGQTHRYSGIEQLLAVTCSESPNPRPADFPDLDAFASRRSGVAGPAWVWLSEPCASWPAVAADRYTGPWNRRTANPVLVIGTTDDPSTPYQGSVAMARQLARARLLTVDGYGHGTTSPCRDRYLVRYLINKILPPKGARCAQSPQPFSG
jgi:pimeloyl-ACP methyl ester carboxylesterase